MRTRKVGLSLAVPFRPLKATTRPVFSVDLHGLPVRAESRRTTFFPLSARSPYVSNVLGRVNQPKGFGTMALVGAGV